MMALTGSFNKTPSESKEHAPLPQIERGLVFPQDESAVSVDVSLLFKLEPTTLLPEVVEQLILNYLPVNDTDAEPLILDSLPVNDTDDAFDNFSLLQELPQSEDIPKVTMASFYRRELTLFGNLAGVKAIEAAHEVVADNAEAVEKLVAKNPSICFCIVRVKDHDGNWFEGNLLQIAAMTGNFNPREPKVPKAHYGLFEKLSFYYPPEEVANVAATVNSPAWQTETAKRMQPFVDAFDELLKSFIDKSTDELTYAQLKERYALDIKKFSDKLKPNPDQIIRFGYAFDLKVIDDAIDKAATQNDALGGWWSYKIAMLSIVGGGSFQKKAARCDARIIKKGIYLFYHGDFYHGDLPNRISNFNKNNVYQATESHDGLPITLGVDFVWDIRGIPSYNGAIWWEARTWMRVHSGVFTKLMSSKNSSAQQFYAANASISCATALTYKN